MKKTILPILIAGFILASGLKANAQYKNAFRVRLGDAYGVTFKTFLKKDRALDLILNAKSRDGYSYFFLTGLYEVHNPVTIEGLTGLRWYYGGGGTIGSINYKYKDIKENDLYVSADGVLGLDYKIEGAPLNVSLDWKPALVLSPGVDFDANGIGLSVRFTF